MLFRLSAVLLLWCGSISIYGQSGAREIVDDFAAAPELRHATISIDVREVATGKRVAAHQPGRACIPASTQKLITTAAALDLLGEEHTFRTRLTAGGKVTDGILQGNLYLVGGGDPTLGSPFLDGVPSAESLIRRWVSRVKSSGIRRVKGAVVGDGSYYGTDGISPGWPWADIGNYYGAGAYGLNFHENSYFLYFTQRQREGSIPPVNQVTPAIPDLVFHNELRSGPRGSGDQAYIYGAPFNYEQYIRGSIPVGTGRFRIRGSIPDPARFVARQLTEALEASGIVVDQPATTDRLVGGGDYLAGELLDELTSPPLTTIVDRTNLRSVNFFAEGLLREINKLRGIATAELSSTEAIVDWLAGRGLATEGINLIDGSGLATRNFLSASFMVDFLIDQADNDRWRRSIPLAGRTGSLRGRLKGTPAEGRLRAKSGSLNAARAYAGYVERADGRELAFSIMVNNYTLKGSELNRLLLNLMRDMCTASF